MRLMGVAGGVAATPILASAYAGDIEPYQLSIERVVVRSPRIPSELEGLKVGVLSDFHLGNGVDEAFMTKSAQLMNSLQPDLILLGGDYVHHSDLGPDAAEALSGLYAPHGVYAVMGNHDIWKGDYAVSFAFEERFAHMPFVFKMLRNANHTIQIHDTSLHIVGLDNVWEHRDNIGHALDSVPENEPAILLVHEPDYAEQAAARHPFALQVSGHSHGGQVCIPFVKPWWTPKWAVRHIAGLEDIGEMKLYTTRGIGMSYLQYRFMCPPEVTLITLRAG